MSSKSTARAVVLAAIGPPRRHVAALGRLAPFLDADDAKLRAEACKLAVEILDDYGGGGNPLALHSKLVVPLVALARRGETAALAPLADLAWVFWRARAYPELAAPLDVLVATCDAEPSAKCLARDAAKGLGKGATRAREGWMYRRMRFEARLIAGEATESDERDLRARLVDLPSHMQLAPPYVGAEGSGDDGITYSMLVALTALRRLAQGLDPCASRKTPPISARPAELRARAEVLAARVTKRVEPVLRELLGRPRKVSKDDYATWRAEVWCEHALLLELAGDVAAARAKLTAARDVFYTYGGLGFSSYQHDAERLGVPS